MIRLHFTDNDSGESAWEGDSLTIEMPEDIINIFKNSPDSIILFGEFVNLLWYDKILPIYDDRLAVTNVFDVWVSTEPSDSELKEYPWKNLNLEDEIFTFDKSNWMISDSSKNKSKIYHII